MLYEDELFELAASDQYLVDDGDSQSGVYIGHETSHVQDMACIVKVVMSIACGAEYKVLGAKGARLNGLGKQVLQAVNIDTQEIVSCFENNRLSPYFYVFDKARRRLKDEDLLWAVSGDNPFPVDALKAVDCVVDSIRGEADNVTFRADMRNYERAAKKNSVGVNRFIDSLFAECSRMLVMRIDLGYSLGYLSSLTGVVSADRVKKDFDELVKSIRKGRLKDGICGYVWKLEFGPIKQFHYHFMLFLDGSKFREDITIAEELGEHWKGVITNGEGAYFNCNRRKEKYRYPALGMRKWDGAGDVDNVKKAVDYLVKLDLLVRANLPKGRRTFGKSGRPSEKGPAGRPRKS